MQRRQLLRLLGVGGSLGVAGCTQSPRGTPTESTTDTSRVRRWARDADPKGPTRPDGAPVSVDQTVTDEPGYGDGIEYFPENRTVRYVATRSGGAPSSYDTWSFGTWGNIETATVGASRAGNVTAQRLGVDSVGAGVSNLPDDAETDGVVISVTISKGLDRDGEVTGWPVATFPDLKEVAPRSVDVTLSIEGDTFSRAVPVYVRYSIVHAV